ncbi:MAG: helix-turn-helix transcriptional regulator [Gammaproteobacteria bacterium]|nr:helix-turn-helix transcriptional regulator [Gammaproteobacteria bacterium]
MHILTGSAEGQIVDARRPIIASSSEVDSAHAVSAHHHPRGQLLYAVSGTMRVKVGSDSWIVTSRTGVWVPPETRHQIDSPSGISYRFLFVAPAAAKSLPQHGTPLEITPLTRELILEASSFGAHYRPGSAEARLIAVLHDRLRAIPAATLTVPLPRDARAGRVCDALLKNPADDRSLNAWGQFTGASTRTLARLFRNELGMSFGDWQLRMRLSFALDRLDRGDSVTRVAQDLGYASPSAFCAMFRRVLGTTTSRYLN